MKESEAVADGAFSTSAARRALAGSFLGTALETYDFILFGTAAGLIFNRLFFPGTDPLAGTLYAFGALAVGLVARPIGGLIIGNYGDRVGRKAMLLLTLGLMSLVTALIGLLPTYAQIGIFAPILLTLVGRHDEILNIGGTKVPSAWAEETVMKSVSASDAGVVSMPNSDGIEELRVAVAGAQAGDDELKARIGQGLSPLAHATIHVVRFDQIPRNAGGKIQRDLLRRAVSEGREIQGR